MKRQQTDYYAIIGIREDGEVIMLDYTFDHGKGFKGATGTRFYPVTQEQIDERNDLEVVTDIYGYLWTEAVAEERTTESQEAYMQAMIDEATSNGYFLGHDDSYVSRIPESFRAEHFPDAVTFECVGGGRMFDADDSGDWKLLLRPDLLSVIKLAETPKLKAVK